MAQDLQTTVSERVDRAIEDQWCTAAAATVLRDGQVLARYGAGTLARVDDAGEPLAEPEAADATTWYDLASLTKVVTATTLLTLVEQGALALDDPVAEHLPAFAQGDKARVTLRHLLSHTSGLPAVWLGWRDRLAALGAADEVLREWPERVGTREQVLDEILALDLVTAPGEDWDYSCVGYVTAMALAERATGRGWADLVTELVLAPLGLTEGIAFTPGGPVAATEHEPEYGRGVVSGIVHDECAWSLGGVSGNAGLFGTLDATARFTQALLADELPCSTLPLLANALPDLLGRDLADPDDPPSWGHSLGLRIGQAWTGDPDSRSHTGFTGTSLMVVPERQLVVVTLSNKVHPRRSDEDVHRLRRQVAELALAD